MKPSWQVSTDNAEIRAAKGPVSVSTFRILNSQKLVRTCADPQLDFAISREELGFDPIRHQPAGEWQGSNLHNCREVRAAADGSWCCRLQITAVDDHRKIAVIAGAGPAGLAAALELLRRSEILPVACEPVYSV